MPRDEIEDLGRSRFLQDFPYHPKTNDYILRVTKRELKVLVDKMVRSDLRFNNLIQDAP